MPSIITITCGILAFTAFCVGATYNVPAVSIFGAVSLFGFFGALYLDLLVQAEDKAREDRK